MKRPRYPEKMLDVAELALLLGESRSTLLARFRPGGEWHPHCFLIGQAFKLPVSAYNAWLETKRVALVGEEA